ncbi:MAG: cytochrome c [Euryarchaeota archaeon]|nr:cytochrome c [Euryarchaeota archaeon]
MINPPPTTEGEMLYKEKCSKCHELRPPLRHTANEWPTTVDRMQSKDPLWISDTEKEKILAYLQANARK